MIGMIRALMQARSSVAERLKVLDRQVLDEARKNPTARLFMTAPGVGPITALSVASVHIPSIDTKKVNTQVLVDNGDTIVLGGIFEQTTRTTIEKVPFLGDVPFVGNLFKRTVKVDDKTELLIFVTPKIVKDALSVR